MKLKMIVAAVAVAASASAFAAGSSGREQVSNSVNKNRSNTLFRVSTNADYSQHVLNGRNIASNSLDILKYRKSGVLSSNSVYVSGKGEFYASHVNTNPTVHTRVQLPHVAFTSTIGWVTGFADVQVTNYDSKHINFPSVYFTVGNLKKSPFYLTGGKKVIDFGRFYSANNFIPTLTRAYFMAYGSQIAAGFSHRGMDATLTLMNDFSPSMINSNASKTNQLSDFALNSSYTNTVGNVTYHVGAGYINATGFNHNSSRDSRVGAVDLNTGIVSGPLSINSEFLMTTRGVTSTNGTSVYSKHTKLKNSYGNVTLPSGYTALSFNTLPHLINFTSHSTVKAWSFDSSYAMSVVGRKMVPYVSYSHVAQNANNNIYQIEVGTRYNVLNAVWLGSSYNYTTGKSSGANIGKFNTVTFDISAYF